VPLTAAAASATVRAWKAKRCICVASCMSRQPEAAAVVAEPSIGRSACWLGRAGQARTTAPPRCVSHGGQLPLGGLQPRAVLCRAKVDVASIANSLSGASRLAWAVPVAERLWHFPPVATGT
jgi:hypothetical protein